MHLPGVVSPFFALWLIACQPKAQPPVQTPRDTVKLAPTRPPRDTTHKDTILKDTTHKKPAKGKV